MTIGKPIDTVDSRSAMKPRGRRPRPRRCAGEGRQAVSHHASEPRAETTATTRGRPPRTPTRRAIIGRPARCPRDAKARGIDAPGAPAAVDRHGATEPATGRAQRYRTRHPDRGRLAPLADGVDRVGRRRTRQPAAARAPTDPRDEGLRKDRDTDTGRRIDRGHRPGDRPHRRSSGPGHAEGRSRHRDQQRLDRPASLTSAGRRRSESDRQSESGPGR